MLHGALELVVARISLGVFGEQRSRRSRRRRRPSRGTAARRPRAGPAARWAAVRWGQPARASTRSKRTSSVAQSFSVPSPAASACSSSVSKQPRTVEAVETRPVARRPRRAQVTGHVQREAVLLDRPLHVQVDRLVVRVVALGVVHGQGLGVEAGQGLGQQTALAGLAGGLDREGEVLAGVGELRGVGLVQSPVHAEHRADLEVPGLRDVLVQQHHGRRGRQVPQLEVHARIGQNGGDGLRRGGHLAPGEGARVDDGGGVLHGRALGLPVQLRVALVLAARTARGERRATPGRSSRRARPRPGRPARRTAPATHPRCPACIRAPRSRPGRRA
jgi:hypothetical protein